MKIYLNPNLPWLKDRLIYLTRHGSHAYGLNTPESDMDIRGICIPPLQYQFGFTERFDQTVNNDGTGEEPGEGADLVIHGLQKFMKLAADANPNMLELLFTEPEDQLLKHDIMKKLLANRDLFLSKRVGKTFTGYAVSQLRKLEATRTRAPVRLNPKRAELVAKFGFDTKDAMHVVRLLRMGQEILSGKGVLVRRPDREELLSIKAGCWTLDHLLAWAERAQRELDATMAKSPLPDNPDYKKLDALCVDLMLSSYDHVIKVPTMPGWGHQTFSYGAGGLKPKQLSGVEES